MPRWLRVVRGMIGMGLAFATAISALFAVFDVAKWILFGADLDLRYLMVETILTGTAPVGFLMGVVFSGGLVITGRRRLFYKLSLSHFAALGAVAGLLLYLALGFYGSHSSVLDDIVNGTFFALVGGGSATGALLLARQAAWVLSTGEETHSLGEGGVVGPSSSIE